MTRRPSGVGALLGVLVAIWAASATAAPVKKKRAARAPAPIADAGDGALLVAGLPLPEGSPFARYARGKAYRRYAQQMDYLWRAAEQRTLAPIRGWVSTHLAGPMPDVVFYPFSGPDALNAVTFFPRGRTYLLYGLEKIGRLPGHLAGTSPKAFGEGMEALRETLDHIIGLNFFRTASMRQEVGAHKHAGVGALIGAFLARTGHTVVGARYIKLDEAGMPQTVWAHKWVGGIEVTFRAAGDAADAPPRVLYYFRGDISDQKWSKDIGMQAFVARQGPMVTFLKAASYLMWDRNFDDIRATVLARSAVIVEESSGVPYHFLTAGPWDVSLWGRYDGPVPIDVFPDKCQPDLKAAIAVQGKGELPFSYGYQHREGKSHLILARRKAPIEVAEYDGSAYTGVKTHCPEKWKMAVEKR